MTTNKKLDELTNQDRKKIREAVQYNLEHLKVDLRLKRMDFFRHNADRICAMINGYISLGKKADGDYGEYKSSCYASQSAYGQLLTNGWKTQKGKLVFEHVIPIDIAGSLLLQKWIRSNGRMNDRTLLKEVNKLIIPCVLMDAEDKAIEWKNIMPNDWEEMLNKNWSRYAMTDWPKPPDGVKAGTNKKLIDEIIALRPALLSGPAYDKSKINPKTRDPSEPIVGWPDSIDKRLNILLGKQLFSKFPQAGINQRTLYLQRITPF